MAVFQHLRSTPNDCPSEYAPTTDAQRRLIHRIFTITVAGAFVAMLGVILYYVYAFAALYNGVDNHAFDWLLGIFSDFVTIMDASLMDSPYVVGGSSYPPLAIALLYPFALICRNAFGAYAGETLTVDQLTSKIVGHFEFWVAFLLFFVVCSLAIIAILLAKYRLDTKSSLKLAITVLVSTPFVYAVMRGNTVYFALIFLLLFLLLYEHKNPVIREIGYLCLVLAGMVKIYPLFFGVYLLCKKKWFASVRIGIYFAIGSLLSFFLYQDGLGNLTPFLSQLGGFASETERLLSGKNLSISSILAKALSLFLSEPSGTLLFTVLNYTVLGLVFLLTTVTACFTRSSLSRAVIAAAIVILFPPISYFYVIAFMIIPFMEYIRAYETLSPKKRRLYTFLFCFLFFCPMILAQQYIFHTAAIILMATLEIKEVIQNEMLKRKNN